MPGSRCTERLNFFSSVSGFPGTSPGNRNGASCIVKPFSATELTARVGAALCARVLDRRARRRLGAPPGDGERARGGAHRHRIRDPAHPLGRRRTGGDVGVAAAPGVGERARAHRYRPRARSSGSSARTSATTRQTPPTFSTSATSATAWQGRARSERATRATRGHAQRTTKPASTVAVPPAIGRLLPRRPEGVDDAELYAALPARPPIAIMPPK